MKNIVRTFICEIVIIAVCSFIGIAALSLSYVSVSPDEIRDHVYESAIELEHLGLGAHIWEDVEETMLDIFTDGLLINVTYTCVSDGLSDILLGTHMTVNNTNPMNSLYEAVVLANDSYVTETYGRYWHGYQIILRPLLRFYTYSDILQINMIVQLILVFTLLYILSGSSSRQMILPFCGMYIFLSPISLFSSLQYSPCFYIAVLSLIALFMPKLQGYWNDTRRNYLFLLAGIATAYFDLLTYPFITLGVPLIAYLGTIAPRTPFPRICKNTVCYSASWCAGYAGMWASKWIIASVLTDENILLDAFEEIKYRSGYFGEKHSYLETLQLNLNVCNKKVLLAALLCLVICMAIYGIRRRIAIEKSSLSRIATLFFVSAYPFIWYAFTKEHSSCHSYFTWHELAISVFGILTIGSLMIRRDKGQS